MNIRPASRDEVLRFVKELPVTIRAVVAENDNEQIAMAGTYRLPGMTVFFGEITDKMREKYPVAMYKAARKILANSKTPVFCKADEAVEASERFLTRLGFVPTDEERLMVWLDFSH